MNYVELAQAHIADLYPIISYRAPQVKSLPAGAIVGTWQYSVPHKVRYILAQDLELAAGVLPADVSRAWVRDQYNLPVKRRKVQLQKSFSAPMLARCGEFGECVYIDISKAYLRVLSMGYDVEYRPGKYIAAWTTKIPDVVAENKFCYSIAVSMSANPLSNITIMGHDGIFSSKPFNVFSNPCLFNLAQDTLNGIAADVLHNLGDRVHYVNTDGFIVDADAQWECIDIIAQWGFDIKVKGYGKTNVSGVGGYDVGGYSSKRRTVSSHDFQNKIMDYPDACWLRDKWSRWAPKLTGLYKS